MQPLEGSPSQRLQELAAFRERVSFSRAFGERASFSQAPSGYLVPLAFPCRTFHWLCYASYKGALFSLAP